MKKEETEVKLPPSNDLHTYSEEELQNFNRKGLLADLTLLEGIKKIHFVWKDIKELMVLQISLNVHSRIWVRSKSTASVKRSSLSVLRI